ncbi:hypothetical protein LSH36_63g05031 [Paralvinella palmiformis]|uniref:C2H2-type domain-containing protein n=1 Tax=Paralvinella palmiformis TaxID=53620 RepID=A0AAD9K3V6_9ANNE|nr:hypothetical protein LSH36_63g05031 [Paralvinella palmiformis]
MPVMDTKPDLIATTIIYIMVKVRNRNTGQKYQCPLCGLLFGYKWTLAAHCRQHKGKYPYYCPTCDKGCASTSYLKRHLYLHGGSTDFECQTCGMQFYQMKELTDHIKTLNHVDPYKK